MTGARKGLRPPDGWRKHVARTLVKIRRHIPAGWRWLVGLLLIVGGVLGFLPVLGFWMIPLGVAVIALDVLPRRRGRRKRK